jgi:signal transduction histidine kinase
MIRLSELRSWTARLLAFARSTEPRRAPSATALGFDALLACIAATASLMIPAAPAVTRFEDHNPWLYGSAAVAVVLPLALRRVYPVAVFWVVLVAIMADNHDANFISFVAIMLAAYSAIVHSRFRGAAVLSVLLAGVMVTAVYPNTSIPQTGRFTALFVLVPVVLIGSAMRRWRHQAGDSAERLRRAEAEHRAATVRALAAERSRIAGELHDVVTHNVSVMVVQAGAARRVLAGSPDDARAALLAVEASGRTALVELQHLLGLLSPVEGMQAQTDAGEPDAPLQPQPGLDLLESLVDRVAAAGLPVELTVTGQPRTLPPGLDLTAYRVVQEALTNAMKHAGRAAAVVTLDYREDAVVVDVSDNGGRDHRPGRAASSARTSPAGVAGSGRGLLGLRERLSLYGGEFDAGPRPAGGWRVRATLPDVAVAASS